MSLLEWIVCLMTVKSSETAVSRRFDVLVLFTGRKCLLKRSLRRRLAFPIYCKLGGGIGSCK